MADLRRLREMQAKLNDPAALARGTASKPTPPGILGHVDIPPASLLDDRKPRKGLLPSVARTLSQIPRAAASAGATLAHGIADPNPTTAAGLALLSGGTLVDASNFAQQVQQRREAAEQEAMSRLASNSLAEQVGQLDSLEAIDTFLPKLAQAQIMGIAGAEKLYERTISLRNQLQTEADKARELDFREREAAIDRLHRDERDESEFERRLELQQRDFASRRAMLERQIAARAEQAALAGQAVKPPNKTQIDAAIRADQLDQSIGEIERWVAAKGRAPTKTEERMFRAGGFLRARLDDDTQRFLQSQESAALVLGQMLMGARVPEEARKAIVRAFLLSAGDSPGNIQLTLSNLRTFSGRVRQLADGSGSLDELLVSVGVDPTELGSTGDDDDPFADMGFE